MSRHAFALAALTLALLAGACDDEPEPRIADPTSEAASESPSSEPPTTSEPPEPEPVRLSPEETVRAWLMALSTAFEAGAFRDVERLSGSGCETCQQFIEPVRETFADGGSYRTKPINLVSLKAKPGQPRVVDVAVEFPAGELIESAGADPSPYPASKEILEFTVRASTVSSVVFLS